MDKDVTPNEEIAAKKSIHETLNDPEVKREIHKLRFKERMRSHLDIVIVFCCFFAFVALVIATGNQPYSNICIMIGAASISGFAGLCFLINGVYKVRRKMSTGRAFGLAATLLCVSIFISAITLCTVLPPENVFFTAFMLIAAFGQMYWITGYLLHGELIGRGKFKNLSAKKKKTVILLYIIESLLAVGGIIGGIFFLTYVSIPCLALSAIVLFIFLYRNKILTKNDKQD